MEPVSGGGTDNEQARCSHSGGLGARQRGRAHPALPTRRQVPILDVEAGLRHTGDEWTLYRSALARAAEAHADDAERIQEALQDGDIQAARYMIHTLKGLAATLGAEAVRVAAAELEAATARGDFDACDRDLESVRDALAQLRVAAAGLLAL